MTTPISFFTPYVLGLAPAVADPLVEQAVLETAIDFCTKTRIWQIDTIEEAVAADTPQYALPMPDSASLCVIPMQVWINGKEIDPTERDGLTDEFDDWQAETGTPTCYLFDGLKTLRLVPVQTDAVQVKTTLALKPTRDATDLPDILEANYHDAIIHGAAARLLKTVDANQAAISQAIYQSGIDDAASKVAKGHSRVRRRSRATFF